MATIVHHSNNDNEHLPTGHFPNVVKGDACHRQIEPEYLRINEKVIDIVKYFMENNKPVAAIYHVPQISHPESIGREK
ncbi:DJ-1/PfpI family protein [Mucilaginibacter sp. BJC16-A38]|uniref:DJ-1/PfpI family protein n=1 Tax=Mucilaginibacter phenanthrenivorans TaxID=1234842 RepID=UPI00280B9FFD|nr:DJ-1/PfpI family protein [Mucilaginibacter phenanthrenivorans]MCR8556527.1 DJ-1/PfpI family protein [Mucilaginibacter phenanthrenivorans]